MSKKAESTSKKSVLQYIVIACCIILVIGASVAAGFLLREGDSDKWPKANMAEIEDKLMLDANKYNLIDSGIDNDKIYAVYDIDTVNAKRFIAGNYINTMFYALYENGYGYQYNTNTEVNEKNSYASSLSVLDMNVQEAYWFEKNSVKIYVYSAEVNGSTRIVISNFAF